MVDSQLTFIGIMLSVSSPGLGGPHLAFSIACQDGALFTPRITHSGQVKTQPSASPPQQLGLPPPSMAQHAPSEQGSACSFRSYTQGTSLWRDCVLPCACRPRTLTVSGCRAEPAAGHQAHVSAEHEEYWGCNERENLRLCILVYPAGFTNIGFS